jgi:hypothetical protein
MTPEQEGQLMLMLGGIDARLDTIEKAVSGNGTPGLSQRVNDLEASRDRIWGAGLLGSFLLGLVEFFWHKRGG